MEISIGTNGETFSKVMGPKLQQKKLWDQIQTFAKVMGPKLQPKKLWDQIETFVKVMGPKVHFNLKKNVSNTNTIVPYMIEKFR